MIAWGLAALRVVTITAASLHTLMTFRTVVTELGLGLDAGGTQTRWALVAAGGALLAEGQAGGCSGLMMATVAGREQMAAVLIDIATQIAAPASHRGRIVALCAGLTGFDGDAGAPLAALMAEVFAVDAGRVHLFNDIELACRAAFAPGQGYLVYAGTGSVAAYVDAQHVLHRAGGRGGLIDDGGSGYWIAREALRHIWRAEDEAPGIWRTSALAHAVFAAVGGSDWAHTRAWVYGASRGQLGELALAVAAAAESDGAARAILVQAGQELARLGSALLRRHGLRPLRLAGRVYQLHSCIETTLRAALPAGAAVQSPGDLAVHRVAAAIALKETSF